MGVGHIPGTRDDLSEYRIVAAQLCVDHSCDEEIQICRFGVGHQ